MDPVNIQVSETEYSDWVLDVGTATFGEKQREKMKDKKLKKVECKNILQSACALLNSGGGIITVQLSNIDYDYEVHGIGSDIETALGELVNGSTNTSFFEFRQQRGTMLIFVQSWCSGIINGNKKLPQLCTVSCNAYKRSFSNCIEMTPLDVENLLRRRTKPAPNSDSTDEDSDSSIGPSVKKSRLSPESENIESAPSILHQTQFQHGEELSFGESKLVEFKEFSTEKFLTRIKEALPKYISGFANTEGGILFIGVNDESRKVVGCGQYIKDPKVFEELVSSTVRKLNTVHICSSPKNIKYRLNVARVKQGSQQHSFVLILYVKPFCCVVFADYPDCWKVENDQVKRVEPGEWAEKMLATDPVTEELSMKFQNELSVTAAPPGCKTVFSIGGAERLDNLQQQLFKVESTCSSGICITPENVYKELLKDYPALGNLLPKMKAAGSRGILIFSRSWAVDIGLPKNQDVICDALLVATKTAPLLYTVVRQDSQGVAKYSKGTAFSIKQKLVNPGGYAGKLCVIPQILCCTDRESDEDGNASTLGSGNVQETVSKLQVQYPAVYSVLTDIDIKALLRALTIVLLNFTSFLSDQLGCKFLNLLTLEQFQNLHSKHEIEKCKKLFVHGLPGTGKTVIAGQLIEKIINTFRCEGDEVLYICENSPLKKFMREKSNCICATRKTFMEKDFPKVKHIIVDEAQNFRLESGNWFDKAERIRKAKQTHPDGPGVFWIFIDYFQASHLYESGLPRIQDQDPREELTKGVRNASKIHEVVHLHMAQIINLENITKQREFLTKLSKDAICGHSIPGTVDEPEKMTRQEITQYIEAKINNYLEEGYAPKQIAILCNTEAACSDYNDLLQREVRTLKPGVGLAKADEMVEDCIILDSIRRFSGLERTIVFGIHPVPHHMQPKLTPNLLVCLASRAMTHLHVLYEESERS
uniref:schlafen family member 13-like n=1 Tax=Pristiophorus japonicus TaxID=55135 RepID=UPI00398E6877